MVRSPYSQDMLRAINDGPKGYKSPSFEKVWTTLLTKKKSLMEQATEPIELQTTGVSIVYDGWTDVRNRALINVIVVCPKGSMFLNVVDCNGEYKHIFWTPCVVHSLNLILKKIGNIKWIKKITNEAKEIEMFITNHHMAQAICRQSASLELLKVVETRFTNHFIMLR
eukprot:Gb_00586 [translate_table: standard]